MRDWLFCLVMLLAQRLCRHPKIVIAMTSGQKWCVPCGKALP